MLDLPATVFANILLVSALAALALAGCGTSSTTLEPPSRSDGPAQEAPPVPAAQKLDPSEAGEPVLVVEGTGAERQERWLPASEAQRQGYTLVELGNDWTPFLFEQHVSPTGQPLPNRYRRVFIGLANDELDGDGQALEPGEKNYLELYGIFPALSVLRERFLFDEARPCGDPDGQAALLAVKSVAWVSLPQMKRNAARQGKAGKELEAARVQARVETLAELAEKQPKWAAKVKDFERWSADQKAIAAAERRLICEGLLVDPALPPVKGKKPHTPGLQDDVFANALRRFQQKHMIYDGHSLRPRTLGALARTTLENDHEALRRAFRERVVAAADVIEDGSTEGKKGPVTYTSASGEKVPLRNLADEYTEAALTQLGLDSPEAALAFFKRHDAARFAQLRAGVKLAPRPEYYAAHMDLSIVVDRGDVWYDPPFDDKDKWRVQWRGRYPSLTLYLDYHGERIPLSRWRTTVGGWRSEQGENGYEYYKYKGSDTGPRVIRKIVSGPVWIAPETTPIRSLVKAKKVSGSWQSVVNYDELGPGYLSAYGVVAGYFVIPGEGDNPDVDRGIRAHGSSNYLSIYSNDGYSHGCHRLPNHLAIRLYDYLLQHRNMVVKGDSPFDFARQFLAQEHVFEMRIPSRGFEFELEPPLPVNVLEGDIKGTLRRPVEGMVPKPGARYPVPPPEEGVDAVTTASGRVKLPGSAPANTAVDSKGGP